MDAESGSAEPFECKSFSLTGKTAPTDLKSEMSQAGHKYRLDRCTVMA